MPALTVVITGDSKKLELEMAKINALAARTGQNIRTSMSGAGRPIGGVGGGDGAGMIPNSTASREFFTLIREMSRGNWTRVPGSLSILLQQFGLLKYLMNPLTIAGAAVIGMLWGLDKVMKALAPKPDALGLKSLSSNFDRFRDASAEARNAARLFFDELARGLNIVERLSNAIQTESQISSASAEADDKAADAQKELALAKLERDHKEHKLTDRQYQDRRAKVENDADQAAFERHKKARGDEVAKLQLDSQKAIVLESEKIGEASDKRMAAERAKELKKENEERLKAAQENMKKAEASMQNKKLTTSERMNAANNYWAQSASAARFAEAQPALNLEADRAESEAKAAEKEAEALKVQGQSLKLKADNMAAVNSEWQRGEEARVKADRERREIVAKEDSSSRNGLHSSRNLTELQRVGAYSSPATVALLDVSKKSEGHLRALREHFTHGKGANHPALGGVKY